MAMEAAEFWSAFEKETGEKVEARSIGEFFGNSGKDGGIWGLLVLTDKSFRFKHMPSDNWLMSLIRRADDRSEPKQKVDIVVPLEGILAINSPKGGFLARLLGPAFKHFSVQCRGDAGEALYQFSVDPSSGLLAALIKAAPAAPLRE